MQAKPKALILINPVAGGGKGLSRWELFRRQHPGWETWARAILTGYAGEAREIAGKAEDVDSVIAFGGDGAVGEVMTGLLERPPGERPALGILAAGTGNDIARNLGIRSWADTLHALAGQRCRAIDVLRIDCQGPAGPVGRYAGTSANIGFAAMELVKLHPKIKRLLGAKIAYYLSVVIGMFRYRPPEMTIEWEAGSFTGKVWTVLVANAEWAGGGGMRIAPGARLDDGLLMVTIVPAMPLALLLWKLPLLARGKHVHDRRVRFFAATTVRVTGARNVAVEVDGEGFGRTPATLQVVPAALRVLAPKEPETPLAGDAPTTSLRV